MILWRIATHSRRYAATDLSGAGAAHYPGRWNETNQPVVYAALSISLAVLETAAHIDSAGLPINRMLLRIDVPDRVWQAREEATIATLPASWAAIPTGHASMAFGSQWLASRRSPILLVPSVIVPEESVALINPQHPFAASITATSQRPFDYNRLFRHS